MKIYTITFNFTTNVGAILQEYALYKFLSNLGHDVKVIDYRPKYMRERLYIRKQFLKTKSIKILLLAPISLIAKTKFKRFSRKYIQTTNKCYSIKDIVKLPCANYYICGSDQIWNPEITKIYDDGYFLNFDVKGKKISYAASCGQDIISSNMENEILKRISDYDAISVREKNLKEQLSKKSAKEIVQVLDPVFLLNKNEYLNIEKKPKWKNYILIYELHEDKRCYELAKKLAYEKKLKIIAMPRLNNKHKIDKTIAAVGPKEFIGLINNAEYIITNSFHATAFSIILEKQFYCIKLPKRNNRILSVLESSGLENRMIEDINHYDNKSISYKDVTDKLSKEIKKSKEFIYKNINNGDLLI